MYRQLSTYLLFFLLISVSCSREKNTALSRTYHSLTAHYNIYYNGEESYRMGVKKVSENFQDNYTRILPVFYFSDESAAQIAASDMKRAIEKAKKVITLKSITAKPELKKGNLTDKQKEFYSQKEFNKWIDENYLLMGKAYVYTNEFSMAIETFKKVITDFPDNPSRFTAFVWLARAYSETGEYRESLRILDMLKVNEELPKKLRDDLLLSYTDLYIKQEQYEKALPYLQDALDHIRDKGRKIRMTYILAQIYQNLGRPEETVDTYRKVIRMNPPYEMTFNAKINMASAFRAGSEGGEEIQNLLMKMLKDDKNIDYRDQIYYALGNIEMKRENEGQAIDYFNLSIRYNINNFNQAGLSYLALGDLYYERPDYLLSQAYYDSTIQNIAEDYDDYEVLSLKAKNLNKLVTHLQVYELEDSLQRLAALPEDKLNERIDQIIQLVLKEEQEEKMKQEMMAMQSGVMNQSRSGSADAGGNWYFYNMTAKGFGQPEFRMKWGNRKLEDNWRRRNKESLEIVDPTQPEGEVNDTTGGKTQQVLSRKTREYYLMEIPLTDSAMELSHQHLEEALYNMGVVYRNDLNDIKEAIVSFDEVLERYPGGTFGLMAAYNLHEIYKEVGNPNKSESYKHYILQNYPNSPRAKIMANPSYVNELIEEQNKINRFYEEVYQAFEIRNFQKVIRDTDYALKEYEGHELIPKFRLLRAISLGRVNGDAVMTSELESVIQDFPDSEVSTFAREVIASLYQAVPELEVEDTRQEAEEIYAYDEEDIYYVGILSNSVEMSNQLNFNLINFHLDNFPRQNFGIEQKEIGDNNFFLIREFEGLESAQRYFSVFRENRDMVFRDVDRSKAIPFMISKTNLQTLEEDLEFEKYRLYFEKYYPE